MWRHKIDMDSRSLIDKSPKNHIIDEIGILETFNRLLKRLTTFHVVSFNLMSEQNWKFQNCQNWPNLLEKSNFIMTCSSPCIICFIMLSHKSNVLDIWNKMFKWTTQKFCCFFKCFLLIFEIHAFKKIASVLN